MHDILMGGAIGAAQTLLGHPLDTIKVRIQTGQPWKSMAVRSYYNGVNYPLLGSLGYNMIAFPSYDKSVQYTGSPFLSGLISGLFVSPFVYMIDVGKVRRQTNAPITLRSFYTTKGMLSNIMRESTANGVYFGSYAFFKHRLSLKVFVAGALAGLCTWTITYPIDVIRSRQMALNISFSEAYRMKNFWKGYIPCAVRALLVNGVSFLIYEQFK